MDFNHKYALIMNCVYLIKNQNNKKTIFNGDIVNNNNNNNNIFTINIV